MWEMLHVGKYKFIEFAEWCGTHYDRIADGVWVEKGTSQIKEGNWIITEDLYEKWIEQRRKLRRDNIW